MAKKAIVNNWCAGKEFLVGKIYSDEEVKGMDPRDFEDVVEVEVKAPEVKAEEKAEEPVAEVAPEEEKKEEVAPAEVAEEKAEEPVAESASTTRRKRASK